MKKNILELIINKTIGKVNKMSKKNLILLICCVMSFLFLISSCSVQNNKNATNLVPTADDFSKAVKYRHIIATDINNSNNVLIGLKTDGTVVVSGDYPIDQYDVSSWRGIKDVYTNGSRAIGLTVDGTVVMTYGGLYNTTEDEFKEVLEWENIKELAVNGNHMIGLKDDGTVVSVGDNEYGQCNVSSWENIVMIATGSYNTIGLLKDGTAIAVGKNDSGQCNVSSWNNIESVCVNDYFILGLKSDGTVINTALNYDKTKKLSGLISLSVSNFTDCIVGIKKNGTIISLDENSKKLSSNKEWTDIIAVSIGFASIYGLKNDGSVVSYYYSKNQSKHDNTSGWKNIGLFTSSSISQSDDNSDPSNLTPSVIITPTATITQVNSNTQVKMFITTGSFQNIEWGDYLHLQMMGDDVKNYSFFVLKSSTVDLDSLQEGQRIKVTWQNITKDLGVPAGVINFDELLKIEIIGKLIMPTATTPTKEQARELYIGDTYGGGIVAYIFEVGDPGYIDGEQHGIIAATNDQSAKIIWSGSEFKKTYMHTLIKIGNGSENTDKIILTIGEGNNYAAGLARAYEGGGFTDWYLPSKDELNILYLNKEVIGGFGDFLYWSSTETFLYETLYINVQDFSSGRQPCTDNDGNAHLRAVRNF
ncbi:MAG: hypothetical protein ACYCYI_09185 [Saccharofermentanales bacterium]